MERTEPLQVTFYITMAGHEPVREWLRSLERDLWEVRTKLTNKISRVIFTVYENQIVLLHGFIKKSQRIPTEDLELAQRRMHEIKRG